MGWYGRRAPREREIQCGACGDKHSSRESCSKCERARVEASHYERAYGPVPEAILSNPHAMRWTALEWAKADGIYWDARRVAAYGGGFYGAQLSWSGWEYFVMVRKEG